MLLRSGPLRWNIIGGVSVLVILNALGSQVARVIFGKPTQCKDILQLSEGPSCMKHSHHLLVASPGSFRMYGAALYFPVVS